MIRNFLCGAVLGVVCLVVLRLVTWAIPALAFEVHVAVAAASQTVGQL